MSEEVAEAVRSMLIDEKKEYPVYSVDSADRVYLEHNTVLLSINWMLNYQKKSEERVITNYQKMIL